MTLNVEDRRAVSELIMVTEFCGQSTKDSVMAVGAICAERAIRLLYGKTAAYELPDDAIEQFVDDWIAMVRRLKLKRAKGGAR